MSGAGNDPAGEGPAGEDVLPVLSPPRAVTVPSAPRYDGATFSFLYDTSGRLVPLSPTDHRVAMLLLVRRGSVAGVPALGSTLRTIRKIDGRTVRTVTDAVTEALKPVLVSPPAIRINAIDVRLRPALTRGFDVVVSYTNLRTLSQQPRTVTV